MNKLVIKYILGISFVFSLISFTSVSFAQSNSYQLINKNATEKTNILYTNLIKYKGQGVMFGHEDDLASGVNWKLEDGRSDIMEVCSDFPAVFGWDVGKIGSQPVNQDGISFDLMKTWMQLTYKIGGINTISWTMDNPVTGGSANDILPNVASLLPGGDNHEFFKHNLNSFADYAKQLNIGKSDSKLIPIIFRPFHESSLEEFWWSRENCTAEEFKALWQFTVNYLIHDQGIKNIIFAYSTDAVNSISEFMEYYPGDEFVDIIGLNLYDKGNAQFSVELSNKLLVLNSIGEDHHKVTAITEIGYLQIPSSNWWTDQLVKGIFANRTTANISYLMIGKNLSSEHFYAPYPEHSSADNFMQLYQNMYTLFLEDIQDVYVAR